MHSINNSGIIEGLLLSSVIWPITKSICKPSELKTLVSEWVLLIDSGLQVDYQERFPYYQIADIKQALYEFNISSSIILKTVLVEDRSRSIFFLGDIKNNREIEISGYCASELKRQFNIEVLEDEMIYLKKFNR